jgi:predicted chitinase
MDSWEMVKTVSSVGSAVLIPIVLLIVGNQFSGALKERELQGKFVELAVSILRETPSEETRNLREWATQVINQYSGVQLSAATKKDLIENTPLLPSATPYEGRRELGNTEAGDGERFIGRGYLQILGRANYTRFGKAIGVDLIAQPEKAEEPMTAAKILVQFFVERKDKFLSALESGDYVSIRRLVNGGLQGAEAVAKRALVYKDLLESKTEAAKLNDIPGVTNPEWTTVHVPAILKALDGREVSSVALRAYILATAEHETVQGKVMKERLRSTTGSSR